MTPNDQRTRILHVISTLEGGAGRGAMELVRELQRNEHYSAQLCVLGASRSDLPSTGLDWVTFLDCPVHIRSTTTRRLIRLRRLIKSWNPSLIHSHLWPSAVTVGLVSPSSIPHLIHIRDTPPSLISPRLGSRLRRGFSKRLFSHEHVRFVSVSRAAAEYSINALQINPDRISTVLNGVRLEQFLAVPAISMDRATPFIALCAGRLISDKGFEDILRAIKITQLPPEVLKLRVAGEGSLLPRLKTLAIDLEISEQVEFLGQVTNMPSVLEKADVFIHNSIAAEGLSRAILEAMGAGRSVISSDHAGAREAIEDGATGFIVPIQSPASIASAIHTLILNPTLHYAIGAAARCEAQKRFSVRRVTDEVVTIYDSMLA